MLSILAPHIRLLARLKQWWAYNTPAIQYSGISSAALLLGALGQVALNRLGPFTKIWPTKREGVRGVERYGSQLEKLLYRAVVERKYVILTLKNGKIYIGRVQSVTPQEDTDLLLLPSKSGYRDNHQQLMLTTDYDQIYASIMEAEENYVGMIADFAVVIPIPEILTASLYNADVHDKYFTHQRVKHRRRKANR